MRLRVRLTAAAATAVACASLGLTGASSANANAVGAIVANYMPESGTTSTAMCLTAGSTSGEAVTIKPCGTGDPYAQAWHWVQPFEPDTYLQMANGYNLCLAVKNGSDLKGAELTAATCRSGHLDQYWEPLLNYPCSEGMDGISTFYPWDNDLSSMVMGVDKASMKSGTGLDLWPYQFKCNNQDWGGVED